MNRPVSQGAAFRAVALGGSITTGYAAPVPSEGGWVGLVARELPSLVAHPEVVNRGVSGTDSAWACTRVAEHAAGADLVILEFAIKDQWLDPTLRRQCYEGLLRQVLTLASRPRVLCLFLHERGDLTRGQGQEQRVIAEHYGVAWVAPHLDQPQAWNPEDPIHPNAQGHRHIADAVLGALAEVLQADTPAPATARELRDPLYSSDWQFVRLEDSRTARVLEQEGWTKGSDVHHEWRAHGGAPEGWVAVHDSAQLRLVSQGKTVGLLYSESEHYRDLVATLGPNTVAVEAHQPARSGYLGWAYRALGRDLGGEHTVTVRFADPSLGSGRAGHVVGLLAAGVTDTGRAFDAGEQGVGPFAPPSALPLTWTGRFDPQARPGAAFGWQLTRLSGRFTGSRLGLQWGGVWGRNLLAVVIDGRERVLEVGDASPRVFTVADDLGEGPHRLEIIKRSEGFFGGATLEGLALAPGGRWLEPEPRRPWRLEFYGDSITAGACNQDGAIDQYDDLRTHDPQLSYAAITARRLDAEVVCIAVSGTGLTCSWNDVLMPAIWDRTWPSTAAPVVPPDRAPHAVVVNLGQNDYGFPQSQGRGLDPEYGDRLTALVQALRARYPETWIVGALGGMTGWKDCADLRQQWTSAWTALQATDARVRSFFFQNASSAHPRVDVHALLAEELTAFLTREVWPHLETPAD